MPDPADSGVRIVVGASRGIGLALAEAMLDDPATRTLIATHREESDTTALRRLASRHGDRLQLLALEATEAGQLQRLASAVDAAGCGFDLALHAAGILHEGELQPEKALADCRAEHLARLFEVNSIAPLMTAAVLLPLQPRGRRFTFAALSAMVGSIGDNRLGGWYGYRASKAALNQFLKTLDNECRHRHPGATVLAIHPGTTDTDLSAPFQRTVRPGKPYSPATTAARILAVLRDQGPEASGRFLNWDGREIPW